MIKVGKYVNTHGIKGEIKLISDFSRKDLVFIKEKKIYILDKEYIIESYRIHKNYDMLKLKNIDDINDIEHLKGNDVFIKDIECDYIVEDFINYKAIYINKEYTIDELLESKLYKMIRFSNKIVPINDKFIEKIDSKNKKIYIREGLI